jgi:hypothetical protein
MNRNTDMPPKPNAVVRADDAPYRDDSIIWGAEAIGFELNLDRRQTYWQLEKNRIPGAFKFGKVWGAPYRILRRLATGESDHHFALDEPRPHGNTKLAGNREPQPQAAQDCAASKKVHGHAKNAKTAPLVKGKRAR